MALPHISPQMCYIEYIALSAKVAKIKDAHAVVIPKKVPVLWMKSLCANVIEVDATNVI